jgi:hypothetical protein
MNLMDPATAGFVLLAMQIADTISTYLALKNPNNEEGNGVIAYAIRKLGVLGGLLAVKVPFMLLFWAFPIPIVEFTLLLAAGLLVMTVHNLNMMKD